eukprot:scaffold166907_cov30-Prasinocladus_malaysianus.AAC.1
MPMYVSSVLRLPAQLVALFNIGTGDSNFHNACPLPARRCPGTITITDFTGFGRHRTSQLFATSPVARSQPQNSSRQWQLARWPCRPETVRRSASSCPSAYGPSPTGRLRQYGALRPLG